MRRNNVGHLKLWRQFQIAQQRAALFEWRFQQPAAIEPENIECDERDRNIRRCGREQIGAFAFSSETFLQVEEGQFAPVLESNNLAVENKIDIELARLVGDFRKLIGDPPQIARINLDALSVPMELCANAIELVFDVNDVGILVGKSLPDRFGCRLGRREHAFDRAKIDSSARSSCFLDASNAVAPMSTRSIF